MLIGISATMSGFNPTLVRLRRIARMREASGSCWFQSHAGSIEAGGGLGRGGRGSRFQSHAGSIEAREATPLWLPHPEFQSHAGSIEAGDGEARHQ